ncbi:unnamed protein product [Rhizophagus irregularis]|nr:unnamed protein product [Rhizophagus irregularis]
MTAPDQSLNKEIDQEIPGFYIINEKNTIFLLVFFGRITKVSKWKLYVCNDRMDVNLHDFLFFFLIIKKTKLSPNGDQSMLWCYDFSAVI